MEKGKIRALRCNSASNRGQTGDYSALVVLRAGSNSCSQPCSSAGSHLRERTAVAEPLPCVSVRSAVTIVEVLS